MYSGIPESLFDVLGQILGLGISDQVVDLRGQLIQLRGQLIQLRLVSLLLIRL